MKKQSESRKRKLHAFNNRGASLITVIITIGFVAILISILMMTSLINFKMKRVNAYAKDTFYSAEQVLDEINIGLQRYISDSLSSAYVDVMENYTDYDSEKKNTIMQTKYYESLWSKLEADSAHKTYDVAVLESFLKDSTKWRGDEEKGYGAILRVMNPDGTLSTTGDLLTYDKRGIVLKNLRVYYKDSKGFVSIIQTDIRLAYPDFDFASSTVLPDVPEYCLIADGGVEFTANAGKMVLTGNIYADSVAANGTRSDNKMKLTHKGIGEVVVKHDMNLKNASFTNEENATLWAENVVADSSNVSLNGFSNLADDLNIKGDGSVISIAGIYNGYGNSILNSDASSAILVNGTNSTLDLSEITRITLAGHAYVGTKKEAEESKEDDTEEETTEETASGDVYTGESVAIKSNQLMYLVPAECIGVNKINGTSVYNKNPLTKSEYEEITSNPDIYDEVSTDVRVDKLGGTLNGYIATKNGVPQPERVFVQTSESSQTLVYYYINFPDEDTANSYFIQYYNANKDSIDYYMKHYVKEIKFPNTTSLLRLKLAGNAIKGDDEAGYSINNAMMTNASSKLSSNQEQYDKQFSALCTKLMHSYSELIDLVEEPNKEKQIVYENIVDSQKIKEFVDNSPYKVGTNAVLTGTEGTAIVAKGDYVVTDANVHLVIAEGNVSVGVNDFKGTVLCNGKATIPSSNGKVTVSPSTVKTMMRYSQKVGEENIMVASVLRDGGDFSFITSDDTEGRKKADSLADLIVYENWKKE